MAGRLQLSQQVFVGALIMEEERNRPLGLGPRQTPHKRVNFHRINPLAEWVAPTIQVPRQNSGGTTLAGAAPVTAVN